MAIKQKTKKEDLSDFVTVDTQSRVRRYSQRWHELKRDQMKYVKLYNRALGMNNKKKQREHFEVITLFETEMFSDTKR